MRRKPAKRQLIAEGHHPLLHLLLFIVDTRLTICRQSVMLSEVPTDQPEHESNRLEKSLSLSPPWTK